MEQQRATIARVTRGLVPLPIAAYLIAYLDRGNVSFAVIRMNTDLGLSAPAYRFGASVILRCLSIERTAPVTPTMPHPAE